MAEAVIRAKQQQSTAAWEGLTGQTGELQGELAQSRQQTSNGIAALTQEVRAPRGALPSLDHRRQDPVSTRGCLESQATSVNEQGSR